MIVYGERRRKRDLRSWLNDLDTQLAAAGDHGAIRDLVVDYGDFEVGLVDAACPERDDLHPVCEATGAAAEMLGRAFRDSWLDGFAASRPWLARFGSALAALREMPLPESVTHGPAEGYAFYALYPECYAEAARQARASAGFDRALAIGLRGIGASLSAVVTGALRGQGCSVSRFTLRPRGHPFDRRPELSGPLADRIRAAAADAAVLIVDEGPGLSGSSFAGTAALLSELGIPDGRIILLPSYDADPASLSSASARARWLRHTRFLAEFDHVWPARRVGRRDALRDISGGAWRELAYAAPEDWPAAQPQHERRKYLEARDGATVLHKFAGLGQYGASKLRIGEALAEGGWTPACYRIVDGFLAQHWIEGAPLVPADGPALLSRLADYIAFRRHRFVLDAPVPLDGLFAMAANALEASFGHGAAAILDGFDRQILADAPLVAVDGRMLPHEWVRAADGRVLKTDALDHHDDHFFPGPQDAAWDLAGTSVEFGLRRAAERALTELYARRTGDSAVAGRVPFYRLAYAAWRLGYAQLAAQTLNGHSDGLRFRRAARRYKRLMGLEAQRAGAIRISARAAPRMPSCLP